LIVFNATFNNISAKSWRPVLVVEEAGVPRENHRPWDLQLVSQSSIGKTWKGYQKAIFRSVTVNITKHLFSQAVWLLK